MRRKRLKLATTIATMLGGLALATEAHAVTVRPPSTWGNQPVSVEVGSNPSLGPYACYLNRITNETFLKRLGTPSGLDNNYVLHGSSSSDGMAIFGGFPGLGGNATCGIQLNALAYGPGNHSVDLRGGAGDDVIYCGKGRSVCLGDAGRDYIRAFSSSDRVDGGADNDKIFGSSANRTDRLNGGSGDDCLQDPGDQHTDFDCGGTESDRYVFPARGQRDCDRRVTDCETQPF